MCLRYYDLGPTEDRGQMLKETLPEDLLASGGPLVPAMEMRGIDKSSQAYSV